MYFQVRRGALEAMEDSHGAASQEREMRKRLDKFLPCPYIIYIYIYLCI
jgi:hypothetical protein